MTSVFRSLLVLVAAGSFVACSGEVRSPDFTPQLVDLNVSPLRESVVIGTSLRLSAVASYTVPPSQGNTPDREDITPSASWTVSDPDIACVETSGAPPCPEYVEPTEDDDQGAVNEEPDRAPIPGRVWINVPDANNRPFTPTEITVTAEFGGRSSEATLQVFDGALNDVVVYANADCSGSVSNVIIAQDSDRELGVEAHYTDGSGQSLPHLDRCVTSDAVWSSEDPSRVCVESSESPTLCPGGGQGRDPVAGRIYGVEFTGDGSEAADYIEVTASFSQATTGTVTGSIPVAVNAAILQSITLCPDVGSPTACLPGANTARGTTVPFRIYGLFSNGDCHDVTGLAGDPPSTLRGSPEVNVAPASATTTLAVGGYQQAIGVPVTVAPSTANPSAETGAPISTDPSDAVDPAFCVDPGTFTPDGQAEAVINIRATVPGQASLNAISTVAVLPTEVSGVYVCPEDRLNENSCVRCPGTAATDDQATRDACYIGTTDTPVQVGEGLQRDFLAFGMISDGSFEDFTSSPELTWLVRAEEDQTITNTADLANIENGDDVDGDGDTTEGRLTLTDNATDVCSDVGVSPCDIIVGAQYQVTQDIVFADALTATILGVQPTNIVVTADPEDGCMASGLGGALPIGIPGLLETTTVQLSAAVSIVLLDETDQPVPGSEFIETNFPVNWDDPVEGTWDNANDVCVEGGTGFGSPVTVTSDGLVEPNPLVTGQACVTGSIRDGMGAVIDPPGDDTDPLIDGGTITVDTLAALTLACQIGDGFDSDEPSP